MRAVYHCIKRTEIDFEKEVCEDPNLVVSSFQVVYGVVMALRRRSHIIVSFSVWCGLLLLDFCRSRVVFAGFEDYTGGMLVVGASNEAVVEVRVDVPVRLDRVVLWSCIVRLGSMFVL